MRNVGTINTCSGSTLAIPVFSEWKATDVPTSKRFLLPSGNTIELKRPLYAFDVAWDCSYVGPNEGGGGRNGSVTLREDFLRKYAVID